MKTIAIFTENGNLQTRSGQRVQLKGVSDQTEVATQSLIFEDSSPTQIKKDFNLRSVTKNNKQ